LQRKGIGADGGTHLPLFARGQKNQGNCPGRRHWRNPLHLRPAANLGLFQKDINVAWDLAPHDISIILHIMDKEAVTINCQGTRTFTPGVEDVTTIWLNFPGDRSAIIQSSWLDPRKIREMTIVGSKTNDRLR